TTPPPAGSSAHLGVGKEIWGSRMGMRRCLARAAGSIAGLGRDEVRGRGGRDLDGEVVEAVRADSLDEGADGAGGQGDRAGVTGRETACEESDERGEGADGEDRCAALEAPCRGHAGEGGHAEAVSAPARADG